jgi:hypothetical protein
MARTGAGLGAATGAMLISGLAELVYHWNVSTPYWLGFIFQRLKAIAFTTWSGSIGVKRVADALGVGEVRGSRRSARPGLRSQN